MQLAAAGAARARRGRPRANRARASRQLPYAAAQRVAGVPACRVLRSDGGWYAVLQVPSLEPEEDLVAAPARADGVLAHPGYFFDFPRESFLIVSLLPPERVVRRRRRRACLRHFDCSGRPRP